MSGKAKKEMTPEQLERLAKAREKALEVKRAMKSKKDEDQLKVLQDKMDAIKSKKAAGKKVPEKILEKPEAS